MKVTEPRVSSEVDVITSNSYGLLVNSCDISVSQSRPLRSSKTGTTSRAEELNNIPST